MTHPSFEAQVDAYLDGELATVDARELEAHLAECPECARFRQERLELRAAITARVPVFPAPDALRERVRTALRAASRVRVPRRFGAPVPSSPRNRSKYLSARRQASCTTSAASCSFRVR